MSRSVFIILVTSVAWFAGVPTFSQDATSNAAETGATGDETFLRELEQVGVAPDKRRLAKLFFSAASTLDGGKGSVRLLERAISTRDFATESTRQVIARRFDDYDKAVTRYKSDASGWLDAPEHAASAFRALMQGGEACWRLDRYVGLVETYGAGSSSQISIVSSLDACTRVRRAMYQPSVRALVQDALRASSERSAENRALREELRELERLLEDLREIDASD